MGKIHRHGDQFSSSPVNTAPKLPPIDIDAPSTPLASARSTGGNHLEIDNARHDAFRPISHAIVKLASHVRGDQASEPFHQMFCPMVKGGAGDWLQPDSNLLNPYWGSQMLTCGDVVRTLSPAPESATAEMDVHEHSATHGEAKVQP